MFAQQACQLFSGACLSASGRRQDCGEQSPIWVRYAIVTKILPRWGLQCTLVNGHDLAEWQAALSSPANIVFLESPSNPLLDLVDIAAVATLAHTLPVQSW